MSVLSGILKTFVGDKAKKDLKGLYPLVDNIHQATAALNDLTHDQLRGQTTTFKKEIAAIRKPFFDKIDALKATIDQTVDVDEKESHYNEIDTLTKQSH
jgi:preprotein translocase subunit SecA